MRRIYQTKNLNPFQSIAMRLKDIIDTNNWLSVSMTLTEIYPDQEESLEAYEKVFENLKMMSPTHSDIEIVLRRHFDEDNPEDGYVDVSGKKQQQGSEITESLALEFTPWTEWLGMSISTAALQEFSELEILSHCIYEMTFVGYDEKEIQEQFAEIKRTMDEYKNMSEEDKRKNSTSLDDLRKDLGEE